MGQGVANVDEFRHTVERLPPAEYLNSAYYDRWLKAIEALLIEKDVIEQGAVQDQIKNDKPSVSGEPDTDAVLTLIKEGGDWRKEQKEPAFDIGQTVEVTNRHPSGHTRCPGYLKRATGEIAQHHGTFVLPDANAHGKNGQEPMYAVEFESAELWGDEAESNTVICADLWESYLGSPDE
jgi:nitrile hydratase